MSPRRTTIAGDTEGAVLIWFSAAMLTFIIEFKEGVFEDEFSFSVVSST